MMKFRVLFLLFFMLVVFVPACESEPTNGSSIDSREPFLIEDGQFKKVLREDLASPIDKVASEYDASSLPQGRVVIARGKPHTSPNLQHNQFSLSVGEDFIVDIAYLFFNIKSYEKFSVVVLANYEPVLFAIQPIEEGNSYPETLGSEALKPSSVITLKDNANNRFTLHVPSISFKYPGAYDVRIVVSPVEQKEKPGANAQLRDPGLSLSMTLYYGGSEFPSTDFPSLQDTEPADYDLINAMRRGLFSHTVLIPSKDILTDPAHNLTRIIDLKGSSLRAYFHSDFFASKKAKVLSNFMVDGVFLRDWAWSQVEPLPPIPVPDGVNSSVRTFLPPLEGEQQVRFAVFEKPFEDLSQTNEGELLIDLSNQLVVKK